MLVVAWATTSEACHGVGPARRPSCYAGYTYAGPAGYYGAGGGYGMAGGGYYDGGYPGGTAGYPGGYGTAGYPARRGTTSAGPATTRAASAGRRPGWGCGPAWAPAASDRGADRPQVLDRPAGALGLDLRVNAAGCRRRSADQAAADFRATGGTWRIVARRSLRPGVAPVATPALPACLRSKGVGGERVPTLRLHGRMMHSGTRVGTSQSAPWSTTPYRRILLRCVHGDNDVNSTDAAGSVWCRAVMLRPCEPVMSVDLACTCNARGSARVLSPRSAGTADVSPRSSPRAGPSRIDPGDPSRSSAPGTTCPRTGPRLGFSVAIMFLAPLPPWKASAITSRVILSIATRDVKARRSGRRGWLEFAGIADSSEGTGPAREIVADSRRRSVRIAVMLDELRSTSSVHFSRFPARSGQAPMTAEHDRLEEARERAVPWKQWGPYLSERQWGTVREDYSEGGDAWNYFSHDQARSRAYRWGEDGLAGISDRQAAALLRPGPVERHGPDPQGAPVRAHQQRGQSRRGRQGVLLLPR